MKNILVIQGGGRAKGNTAQLIEHFAGGCGDTNGKPGIDKTSHLKEAYKFGRRMY